MPKPGNDKKLHLPLLFFLLLLWPSFLSYNNDNNAWGAFGIPMPPLSDAEVLLAFKAKADPGNRLPFFANRSTDHCRWAGVRCSAQGRVIRLILEGYGLNGTFAERTLPWLGQLRILSLKANALVGPIPDLSKLVNLKALFLDHNLFAGSFPASLLSLRWLRTLNLSHNNLSGPIPSALISLDRLYSLHLEWNRFNGSVPPLNRLQDRRLLHRHLKSERRKQVKKGWGFLGFGVGPSSGRAKGKPEPNPKIDWTQCLSPNTV